MMLLALIVSAVAPYERSTWWMEVAPIFIITPLLWWTRKSFRLTSLLLGLIALHSLVLIIGGTYTYARVPFGFYLQDAFHLSRNPYDKIGHFMQGFVVVDLSSLFFKLTCVRIYGCVCRDDRECGVRAD